MTYLSIVFFIIKIIIGSKIFLIVFPAPEIIVTNNF